MVDFLQNFAFKPDNSLKFFLFIGVMTHSGSLFSFCNGVSGRGEMYLLKQHFPCTVSQP